MRGSERMHAYDSNYEHGLTEGRLNALEDGQNDINDELEKHQVRIAFQERIVYGVMGAVALLEFGPKMLEFVK